MRRTLLALALGIASCSAMAFDVTSLFERLSKSRPGEAPFREKKYMSLLDKPVESAGVLIFTPPDTMEKRTTLPRPERVVVDRDRVRLERGGKTFSMALRDNPGVSLLVEGIRGTLAGDLGALTKAYSVGLDGNTAAWKLRLRPLDPASAQVVERIEISGAEAVVKTVEIFQADGDRSVMSIGPAAK